ncbi:endonuclease MutS2 [Calothrix rhizosoleniae]|uniref:endonuclease MutS2 n=1 Tax=Calothrix rhizosoleniae TaxID=888997 RepID=UPI000B49A8CF|nr:endonuclease MutS2 [Calothrix rhizosoleniae]
MIQSETLELLEWHRLCQHLSTFAATKLGAMATLDLQIPPSQPESEYLLTQTKEIYELDNTLLNGLSFEGIQDIGDSLERAELQGILTGEELLAIATTLAGTRNLRRTINERPDLEILNQLVAELRTYPELEQDIHHCIDERGQVADRASQKLAEIRQDLRKIRIQINQKLHNILQVKANAVQEQIITQRGDRFVIPVKSSHKDRIPGIVHDTSTSGVTLYIEPSSVVPMGNQLRQLMRREQVEEEAIRRSLTEKIAEVIPDLEKLLAIATALDMATAKARYSLWLEANPPRLLNPQDQETINLRQLRHPLLVWQQNHEQGSAVIPVDLRINPEIRVVTITGPNTGGKTVTLKTLGLAALMAKVGLFIPAREPVEIPWFDHILADIGDEQSLQQNLSTFSGHIRRISRILEALSEENTSLILLDEVGAGTDPAEGSALAIALLEYLADNAQLTMATTHFGELKALKYQNERFENASVEFDETTLSPTYRLLWGIPGRSNALAIASRLGLKGEVIEQAKNQLGEGTDEVNQVIAGLEAQRRSQETKAAQAEDLLQHAERLYQEVNTKADSLQERERALRADQEIAVQKAIAQAKAEIAQVIRRLQQGEPTAQNAQKATNALEKISAKFTPPPPPKEKIGFIPKIGDRIRIPKLAQTAEVLTAPNGDGELNVRLGIMKMTVQLEDIESLDGKKAESLVKEQNVRKSEIAKHKANDKNLTEPTPTPVLIIRTSKNTIDLRGKRVADAEIILDKAIAEATGAIWAIHGHGTGKLRQGVQEFLRQHPRVKRYEAAPQTDGGTGVTIAYVD